MNNPLILVTNDDGISANGIRALVEVAQEFGEVIVVAPDSPQSGMGHAITMKNPLRLKEVSIFNEVKAFKCSGTPVDCVKIAVDVVLDRKPDLCVSGINHGSNASINVIYSGTMSAAMEAAIEGVNSIGFSHVNFSVHSSMETSKIVARKIIEQTLKNKLPQQKLLNVNIPDVDINQLQGIKICRQAKGRWTEEFDKRTDPFGKEYYWLTGQFDCEDKGQDTDIWALNHNFVSIVPVQHDLTEHQGLSFLNEHWNLDSL